MDGPRLLGSSSTSVFHDGAVGSLADGARHLGYRGIVASDHRLGARLFGGVFLCISLSDLLPEMEFHSHNRIRLSVALILGIATAWGIGFLEPKHAHHGHEVESIDSGHSHDDHAQDDHSHDGHSH